jgi:hypothetical protein
MRRDIGRSATRTVLTPAGLLCIQDAVYTKDIRQKTVHRKELRGCSDLLFGLEALFTIDSRVL